MNKSHKALAWALGLALISSAGCQSAASARKQFSGGDSAPAAEMAMTASMPTSAMAQRSIIRNGSLRLKVTDLDAVKKQAVDYVNKSGGFVEGETSSNLTAAVSQTELTLRVPVKQFERSMDYFGGLGIALDRSVSAQDITREIVDMTAHLRVMKAQEEVYLSLLKQSKSLKDSMSVQQPLMELRQQIESLEAQLKSQNELAALSTITLTLRTDVKRDTGEKSEGWVSESVTASTNSLGAVFRSLGRTLIGVGVFAPLWLPPVLLVVWLARRKKPAA